MPGPDVGPLSTEPIVSEVNWEQGRPICSAWALPPGYRALWADHLPRRRTGGYNRDGRVALSSPSPPRLVRKQAWGQGLLIEGTEALLWPAEDGIEAAAMPLPDPDDAVRAILSWVRPKVLRFQMTVAPQGFPELVLVSTQASSGPAQFVVRKSYQITTTVVCDPPDEVHIVERRDLFRVPVATPVTLTAPSGKHALYSIDISTGGVRVCSPEPLQIGTEVDVSVELGGGQVVEAPAVVRHSRSFGVAGGAPRLAQQGERDGCPSQVGLQFLHLAPRAERQLAQFVARHQRRLMPRVKTFLTAQYSCDLRPLFVDAPVTEVSPGEIVLVAREAHLPGEPLGLRLRVGGRAYNFGARVVSCKTEAVGDGERTRHLVVASLAEGDDIAEERFRIAVRDLALEQWPPEPVRPI